MGGGPVTDRRERTGTGQHCADPEDQQARQGMPLPTFGTRVLAPEVSNAANSCRSARRSAGEDGVGDDGIAGVVLRLDGQCENHHQSLTGHTRHTRHTVHIRTNPQVNVLRHDFAGALGMRDTRFVFRILTCRCGGGFDSRELEIP